MKTVSFVRLAVYAALGDLLVSGGAGLRAQDGLDSRITIMIYDYDGVPAETLLKAEQEAGRVFGHSGVDITWRLCRVPRSSVPIECPKPGPMTLAVRLVPRFQPAPGMAAGAMGYSTGYFATISVQFAQKLESKGMARLPELLGHVMAHEIGHQLLPREEHSVSGIMRAQWGSNEWKLMRQGHLNFAPQQSRFMRAELRRRSPSTVQEAWARSSIRVLSLGPSR